MSMNVTFRQLKVFEAVARRLSYTKAAQELFLTQPAVSMQIRQLEENIGLPMFEQLGKKIYLTEAGKELYHYSRVIAQQLDEVEEILEEIKGVRRGRLSVAVASTANYFATDILAEFSRKMPSLTLSLEVTNRERLLELLEHNEKDIVIMGKPPEHLDLEAETFMDNPLVVIAAPHHRLAGQAHVPLEALREETFVVREAGSGTRIAMERFFEENDIHIQTGMEMTSNEAIKQSVMSGLGLGIVSIHTVAMELETERLAVLDVETFPILRHWYVVHRHGKRLSPVAEEFSQFVLENAAKIWPMPPYPHHLA